MTNYATPEAFVKKARAGIAGSALQERRWERNWERRRPGGFFLLVRDLLLS